MNIKLRWDYSRFIYIHLFLNVSSTSHKCFLIRIGLGYLHPENKSSEAWLLGPFLGFKDIKSSCHQDIFCCSFPELVLDHFAFWFCYHWRSSLLIDIDFLGNLLLPVRTALPATRHGWRRSWYLIRLHICTSLPLCICLSFVLASVVQRLGVNDSFLLFARSTELFESTVCLGPSTTGKLWPRYKRCGS